MKDVFIVSAVRTPIGSFMGSLSSLSATQLGAVAIKGAINKIKLKTDEVQDLYMGNVLSANLGQAPAKQTAIFAGLNKNLPCTTINKVCASGMKSVMIAAQTIILGENDVVVAGGMESMSNVPFYLDKVRNGYRLGSTSLIDGLIKDGLWDVYNDFHMGNAAEICAREYKISREEQDKYAIESYKRSAKAWKEGRFNEEIVPVVVPQKRGGDITITEDEEYKKVKMEKIPNLPPVFEKDGTITPANASTLNDGAAALILMSEKKVKELNIKPLAVIRSFADAANPPEWFTTAPAKAITLAISKAGLTLNDIDYFEINEAFSVVSLVNIKKLHISSDIVNVNGGAVSLGHPLGCSGARIIVTLINVLKQNNAKYGVAGICNGGGGASAIVIENLI